jgi:hypothetical protein
MTGIIHLYNPPTTLPAAEAARRYGAAIWHNDAGPYVGAMRASGWAGSAQQYVLATQINAAGTAFKNNLGGIFPTEQPTWAEGDFLHNGSGARLYEIGWNGIKLYAMNPASSAWRAWAFPRFVRAVQPWATSLFLDNVDLHLYRLQNGQANANGVLKEFGNNDATFRAAMLDYVRALCAHVRGALPPVRVVGNLISSYDAVDEFDPFLGPTGRSTNTSSGAGRTSWCRRRSGRGSSAGSSGRPRPGGRSWPSRRAPRRTLTASATATPRTCWWPTRR